MLVICFLIPGSYLLLDAVLVNGNLYDLPGGLFALSAVGPTGPGTGGGDDTTPLSNKVGITLMDKLKGSGMSTLHVYLYDGVTLLEDLTTASTGYIASTGYYPSGKVLNVKIDTGNSEIWDTVIVRLTRSRSRAPATPITSFAQSARPH